MSASAISTLVTWLDGTPGQGCAVLRYESGGVFREVNHRDGVFCGPSKKYYENGNIAHIGQYDSDGKETGTWQLFDPNGGVWVQPYAVYHNGIEDTAASDVLCRQYYEQQNVQA